MEASTHATQEQLAATAAAELIADEVSPVQSRHPQPFRRFRAIGGRAGLDDGYVERVEAELALLREENARLRFERVQRPDAGAMIERLRSPSAGTAPGEDHRDEAWQLIGAALVMREVLADVCNEIGQTSIALQTRLANIGLDLPDRLNPT